MKTKIRVTTSEGKVLETELENIFKLLEGERIISVEVGAEDHYFDIDIDALEKELDGEHIMIIEEE